MTAGRRTRLATALLLCSLLASCASLQPAAAPAATATVQAVPAIDLAGRLSVRYQRDGKDEAIHGSFRWTQRNDRTLVTLLSPLGQTLATIAINPLEATLTQSGQPPRSASDPATLVTEALGWPLPLDGLRGWLQGQVTDAAGQNLKVSPDSSVPILTSDGWQLSYASWDRSDPALPLHPKRIDLSRNTAQAGQVMIRIVIDDWQPI